MAIPYYSYSVHKNKVYLLLLRGEHTASVWLDLLDTCDTIDDSTVLSCLQIWFGVGALFSNGSPHT